MRDEKTVLIETVWAPFAREFVENLQKEVDLTKIDYIIANHGEVDHSGALPELMRLIPDTPIYCTANAVKSLKGQYHQDWNFKTVKTGDRLSIGTQGTDLHRGADAPLARQHVLLSDRRQCPVQHRCVRAALCHGTAVQRPGRPGRAVPGVA